MSNFRENVASAFRALRENWLRTALTMLGIVIGVGSVVLLVGIGQGVKLDVTKQIDSLGANFVGIVPGKLEPSGQPNFMATLGISTLTEKDVADLSALPGIKVCVPLMFVGGTVEHGKETYSSLVIASKAGIYDIRRYPFEDGRFFRTEEEDSDVCVLSNTPKHEIFGDRRAVGQSISVRGHPFRIVGVLKPEDESVLAQFSFTNVIYLPLAASKRSFHGGQINRIFMATDMKRAPDPILASIKSTMRANHGGKEDFGLLTQKQILGAIYKVFNIVTALLAGISAISLVVAGIGIMNIMLVTVTERTREIGIRKTVGARRKDVFVQFLTEAVALSFVGGVIGTILATGICAIIGANTALRPLVTPAAVFMAFGVCFLVGIVFGVAPAMRAARQDPIEALRWE